jgi:hypothetical protein
MFKQEETLFIVFGKQGELQLHPMGKPERAPPVGMVLFVNEVSVLRPKKF